MEIFLLVFSVMVLLISTRNCNGSNPFDCTSEGTHGGLYCSKSSSNLAHSRINYQIGDAIIEGAIDRFVKNFEYRRSKVSTHTCSGIPTNFLCGSEGRFPDWSDISCMWYFECDKESNGNFLVKYLRCPTHSLFSPTLQKCTTSYTCPCNETMSSTAEPIVTTSRPFWCSGSVTEDFTCTDVGRFPDFRDVDCHDYYLCSKLHNGSYLKTQYSCRDSAFDPEIGRCSKKYACPCITEAPTTLVPVTSESSSSNSVSSSTMSSTSTEDHTCRPPSNEIPDFDCSEIGRYPDLTDPECQKYFLCSKLHNGSYIKTPYVCPDTGFDPHIGKCNISYTCPCSSSSVTTTSIIISSSSIPTFTTIDSSSVLTEFTTIYPTDGTSVASTSISSSPAETSSSTEESSKSSTISTISTSYPCLPVSEEVDNFVCSTVGRFPDLTDQKCQKYFLCSKLRNGTFIRTDYSCPGTKFDPHIGKCNASYECPCAVRPPLTTTSSERPVSITTEVTQGGTSKDTPKTTISPTTTPYPCIIPDENSTNFVCTTTGRFPDLTDQFCQKYYLCSKLKNGTFIRTDYSCPESKFDPRIGKCNITYNCPCAVKPLQEFAIQLSSSPAPPPVKLTEDATSDEDSSSSSSSSSSDESSSAEQTTSSTVSQPSSTSESSAVSYSCLPPSSDEPVHDCTTSGRFPDLTDQKCQKYFLCMGLRDGRFVRAHYSCPGSKFDPYLGRCSAKYKCPCSDL